MCKAIGAKDMDDLMNSAIPDGLPRLDGLDLGIYTKGMSESEFLEHFKCDAGSFDGLCRGHSRSSARC